MTDGTDRDDVSEPARILGHLTVLHPTGQFIRGAKVYECRCVCGNVDKATILLLRMGRKTSCGCHNRKKSESPKPGFHTVERLRTLAAEDGRPLAEIAAAAGLAESLISEGLAAKKDLTLATTCSLLKVLGRQWSDLDEPDFSPNTANPAGVERSLELPSLASDFPVSHCHMGNLWSSQVEMGQAAWSQSWRRTGLIHGHESRRENP